MNKQLIEACKNLLAIVRLQNGNLYEDINELQAQAETAIKAAQAETTEREVVVLTAEHPAQPNLKPIGVVFATSPKYGKTIAEARELAIAELKKQLPAEITHVFNLQFEDKYDGHIGNNYRTCLVSGDGYTWKPLRNPYSGIGQP